MYTYISDSEFVLTTLYAPLPYLIPKFLTDIKYLLITLSNANVVHI